MIELPNKTGAVWQRFFTENKVLVQRYVVRQIKKGLQHNLPKVGLFTFSGTKETTYIYEKNYLYMLENALQMFIKEEAYEDAQIVKSLIDTHYINKLIEESLPEA